VAALLLLGCGYALVGKGSAIPEDIRTLYLEPFANQTPRVEVEQFITQAVADELVKRRRFVLVQDRGAADAVLSGRVTGFRVVPLSFDSDGRAQEYEVSVLASVKFARSGDDEPIWENDSYVFRDNYEVEATGAGFFDRENLAIDDTAQRFAQTLVSDLLEGF
jgi:outer membrane lipopolysaccharide assembly protein LptE/RlpB